jgi:Tfp pilus assembly protein PilV
MSDQIAGDGADAPRRPRRRMSLSEVVIAVGIMVSAMLADSGITGRSSPDVSVADMRVMAGELAAERLDAARAAGHYADLDSMATLESTIPDYPGFTRVTSVRHVRGGATDTVHYHVVTTAVSAAGLPAPERRTIIVGVRGPRRFQDERCRYAPTAHRPTRLHAGRDDGRDDCVPARPNVGSTLTRG